MVNWTHSFNVDKFLFLNLHWSFLTVWSPPSHLTTQKAQCTNKVIITIENAISKPWKLVRLYNVHVQYIAYRHSPYSWGFSIN